MNKKNNFERDDRTNRSDRKSAGNDCLDKSGASIYERRRRQNIQENTHRRDKPLYERFNRSQTIRDSETAMEFLKSLVSANDIKDPIRWLLLPDGQATLLNCIDYLDLRIEPNLVSLSDLVSKMGEAHVFRGNVKEDVIHIYSQFITNASFVRRLRDRLTKNPTNSPGVTRAIIWMLCCVYGHPNTNTQTLPSEISSLHEMLQNRITHVTQFERELLENTFSDMSTQRSIRHIENHDVLKLWEPVHSNDFPDDFRKIAILPTVNELNANNLTLNHHYRGWIGSNEAKDAKHIDRQFRLLRADMICSLEDELMRLRSDTNNTVFYRSPTALEVFLDNGGKSKHFCKPYVNIQCFLPERIANKFKKNMTEDEIVGYLENEGHRILSHNSLVLFLDEGKQVVALGTVCNRNVKIMADAIKKSLKSPNIATIVGIEFRDDSMKHVLQCLQGIKSEENKHLQPLAAMAIQVRMSTFTYEPVLKGLKGLITLPLREELILERGAMETETVISPPRQITRLLANDPSQQKALMMALRNKLSIIQGPPGTGKTFLGVQIVRSLLQDAGMTILCICYTNHALDSFLESLLNSGIPENGIVRLGSRSKVSERLRECMMDDRRRDNFSYSQNRIFKHLMDKLEDLQESIVDSCNKISTSRRFFQRWDDVQNFAREELMMQHRDIAESLLTQLSVPQQNTEGLKYVGKHGNTLRSFSHWQMWIKGESRPSTAQTPQLKQLDLWAMPKKDRQDLSRWLFQKFVESKSSDVEDDLKQFYERLEELQSLREEIKIAQLATAKIVACTTTYAAMNKSLLDLCDFRAVLVEEAAEILESHVLVNISNTTQRLIMIGDHKQLRPKLEYYPLCVDSRQGFDFDKSLFERLVESGYPVATLAVQHRMRPEISQYIRQTYPELQDHASTNDRANIRGTYLNVAFIHHSEPENQDGNELALNARSKSNDFEVRMCLAMTKYFLHQGYKIGDIVILTPYLGQLLKLRQAIKGAHLHFSAQLGEKDMQELEQEGFVVEKDQRQQVEESHLRIATIDNFQGEEANIIIASMVRSNKVGDIGFVKGAERVNVLFSRARDGFYVVGNAQTFSKAEGILWKQLLKKLKDNNCLIDGFPAFCKTHNKLQLLRNPEDFDRLAPSGGCNSICGQVLPSCPHRHVCVEKCHPTNHKDMKCVHPMIEKCRHGMHDVTRLCHRSEVICNFVITGKCPKGHLIKYVCSSAVPECKTCHKITKERVRLSKMRAEQLFALSEELEKLEIENARVTYESELERILEETELKKKGFQANIAAAKRSVKVSSTAPIIPSMDIAAHPRLFVDIPISSGKSEPAITDAASSVLVEPQIDPNLGNFNSSYPFEELSIGKLLDLALSEKWVELFNALSQNLKQLNVDLRLGPCIKQMQSLKEEIAILRILVAIKLEENPELIFVAVMKFQKIFYEQTNEILASVQGEMDNRTLLYSIFLYCLAIASHREGHLKLFQNSAKAFLDTYKSSRLSKYPSFLKSEMEQLLESPNYELKVTNAEQEKMRILESWQRTKLHWKQSEEGQTDERESPSEAVDILLRMTGLVSVKEHMLEMYKKEQLQKEQEMSCSNKNLNTIFEGNPGTGKTTVANLYCQFLIDLGVLPEKSSIIKKTGSELANIGVRGLEALLVNCKDAGGGVVFVDEAYQLNSLQGQGRQVLDFILGHSEKMEGEYGKLIWIFAGYKKQIDDLLNLNPGLPSRFPNRFTFEDYTEEELQSLFMDLLKTGGEDIAAMKSKVTDKKEDSKKKPASLPMSSNNSSRFYLSSNAKPDQRDEWGNIWRWDTSNYTFVDDYNNITGYGVKDLGSHTNPVVSRDTNIMWCYDRQTKLWYNKNIETETRSVYPGKPLPKPPKPNRKPFKVVNMKFVRIAMRRLGKRRDMPGFGNARAIRNLFDQCHTRMNTRIQQERDQGLSPDIFLFQRDDILGPKATMETFLGCKAWQDLEAMEGLVDVKESVKGLVKLVVANADREEKEYKLFPVNLNRIFLGNPGTGKTTVAALYARILSTLGLLTKGEVIEKKASDFVGDVLGKSEEKTRGILEQAMGSVLVIDEAYGLYQTTSSGVGGGNDPYREAVINTLVEHIQGVPGEDRAVILLGYKEEMQNMLSKCNPGLSRRFQLEYAFHFADYDDATLTNILIKAAKKMDLKISPAAAIFAVSRLAKARAELHFGNAGAVNNLLSNAMTRLVQRLDKNCTQGKSVDSCELLKEDFVPEGWTEEPMNIEDLFSSFVGCDNLRTKLEEYYAVVEYNKSRGKPIQDDVNFNFVFMGAPGTGKTTTARLIGNIFCSLGLLPNYEVIEVSASDLMTGFVGQTGKKTREFFDRARGKVLFIDEAYQLNPNRGGSYMQEAVDEIVKLLTAVEYKDKLVVILAGYKDDMYNMLEVNPGLPSRFTEHVIFDNFTDDHVKEMIIRNLGSELDASVSAEFLSDLSSKVVTLPSFANGRDIDTLLKSACRQMKIRFKKLKAKKDNYAFSSTVSFKIIMEDLDKAYIDLSKSKGSIQINDTSQKPLSLPTSFLPPATQASHYQPQSVTTTVSAASIPPTANLLDIEDFDEPVLADENVAYKATCKYDEPQTLSELMSSKFWGTNDTFLTTLQDLLNERSWHNEKSIERLCGLSFSSIEVQDFLEDIKKRLKISDADATSLLKDWIMKQKILKNELRKQAEKHEQAKAEKKKALVPIWRCGVCGMADQPYIACYVQPFIVRYEEREIK